MTHRLGFALEHTLGNTTHAENLKRVVAEDSSVRPFYADLNPFASRLWLATLPGIRNNWQVRASLEAYLTLRAQWLDGAFFHTHSTSLFSAGLMRRVPSVLSLDATRVQLDSFGAHYGANPNPNPRIKALNRRLYQRAYTAARHLVTFSAWTRDSLIADYHVPADKVTVMPQGVDVDFFRPDTSARPGDGVTRLLFVGGEFERKGGDLLLRWARETRTPTPWQLHVAARSEVPETPGVIVHRGIRNNTPELARLYQQSDIFVLPTRADCSPWVVIEAMACGLPVVSSRVGGITEMSPDGETGFLLEPDDYPGLAERLDALVSDAGLRRRLGDAGRRRAEMAFSLDNYRRVVAAVRDVT